MAIHVSASALNDFISCNNKVYYRLFETGEAVPTKEMLMGTVTHKILEKHWNSPEDAHLAVVKLSASEGLDLVSIESIHHFIATYFERFRIMVRDDDKIEKRFKVKLYDDVYLVGVFDRVSLGTIIDWKTTASPPKRIDNNVQFIIYNLAYNMIYNKRPEGLYLAALKDGSLIRYTESKQHTDTLINGIIPEFVQAVKSRTFVKNGLFTGACYRCPYKIACLGEGKNELVNSEPIKK